jgi:hypothetical protein
MTTITPTSTTQHKVRENRLRRAAYRQGLRLEKSRRRDPRAVDYGTDLLLSLKLRARLLCHARPMRLHRFTFRDSFGISEFDKCAGPVLVDIDDIGVGF